MNGGNFFFSFVFALFLFTQLEAQQTFDWKDLTSADCSAKETLVKYDSSSAEAIRTGRRTILFNEQNKSLQPLTISVLAEFLSDSTNFMLAEKRPSCKFAILEHAFVFFIKGRPLANIQFGLNNRYWVFDPPFKGTSAMLISSKGDKKLSNIFTGI